VKKAKYHIKYMIFRCTGELWDLTCTAFHNRDLFFARGSMLAPRSPGLPNGCPGYRIPAEVRPGVAPAGIWTYTTNSAGMRNNYYLPQRQTLPNDLTYFFIPGDLLAKIHFWSTSWLRTSGLWSSLLPVGESPCAVKTFTSSQDSCEGPENPADHTGSKK
jgi:hypothetical protein